MAMSLRDLLTHLIEIAAKEGTGRSMSMALTLADETGIVSTVKVGKDLQEQQPGHMAYQLVVLSAMYYKRYCEEAMDPETFIVDTGKPGTMQ